MAAKNNEGDNQSNQKVKMQTLNEIMERECSIVCGPAMIDLCEQYHASMENLSEICHVDPHFSHVVSGSGFINVPLLLYLRETELSPDILYLAQAQPAQKVLYVHRHSVVLKDPLTHWQKDCPLLLYVSDLPCRSPENVKLFISSKTHSHMLRGSFGINFDEKSTVVLEDQYKTVKFFLSSTAFQKNFSEQISNFLSCYKPTLAVVDRKNMRTIGAREEHILSEYSDGRSRLDVYAFKTIPAFYLPDWPDKAFSWQTRRRSSGWPSKDIVMDIVSKGCHIIPANTANGISEETDWTLCFTQAEKKLFSSLCELDKQASFIFRSLICDRQSIHRGKITIDHIKTTLLWTFEECSAEPTLENPLLARFMQIASKFMEFLSSGRCRHYFIPEKNLFEAIPMQELENIRDMVDELLQQPWIFILHCHLLPYAFYNKRDQVETLFFSSNGNGDKRVSILNDFTEWCETMRKVIYPQVQSSFIESFNDTVRLYVLTSCARANNLSLNESIIHHRDTLRMAQDQFLESPYIGPFADILCSNLASLYHVKALNSLGKREKEYYLIKAEGLLKESKTMDISLGRTRLANLYFTTDRYHEAIDILDELLELLDQVEIRGDNVSPEEAPRGDEDLNEDILNSTDAKTSREKFGEMLWEKWLKRGFSYDVIYNHTTRTLCPSVMKRSLSLTMCNTLGIQKNSAAVFSPIFHGRFLLALCKAKLMHSDQALDILLGLDAVLSHPQMIKALESSPYSDVNEKRIAGYYIVLGNCYAEIEENEKAKTAYKKALKVFPTPRNPANYLYMSVRYDDTINGIKQGAKALILASALSFTYSYMTSQLQ